MPGSNDPTVGTGTFQNPVDAQINSDYGPRTLYNRLGQPYYNFHHGLDFLVATGTPVKAMDGGRVLYAGDLQQGFGKGVIIDHGNGMVTAYAHMSNVSVRQDQILERGSTLGLSGRTGAANGAHLHVEVNRGGNEDLYRTGRIRNDGGRSFDGEPYLPGAGDAFRGSYLDRISLQRGDKLPVVAELQRDLIAAGYEIPAGPTGYYGEQTEAAVRAFQTANGLDVDGEYGRATRDALQPIVASLPTGNPRPDDPAQPSEPNPAEPTQPGTPTVSALDTPGPFAAVAIGDLIRRSDRFENGVAFSSLDLDQTRATVRAIFGDGVGAETLSALGAQHGDERTFLQRVTALGMHEGALSFGRANADPAAGQNRGTFQEGGRTVRTQLASTTQYEVRIADGIAVAERTLGRTIDPASLTPADRDVMAFVGYRTERSAVLDLYDGRSPYTDDRAAEYPNGSFQRGDPGQLFRVLANPTLTRAQTIEAVSRLTQGGVPAIGESVAAWTAPGGAELSVDLAAVERRAREPDATRAEPALGTLRRGDAGDGVLALQGALARLGHDLGATGAARDGVDGAFGDRTQAAVRAEQERAGLTPDGVVGPETWGAIAARVSPEIAPTADSATPADAPRPPGAETAPAPSVLPGQAQQRVAEAYRTLSANPDAAVLLDQVDGLARNLLNEHTGGAPGRALDALTARARELDRPLTAADVQETLRAGTPAVTGVPTLQAEALAGGLNVGVGVERAHPDVAAARETLRQAQSDPSFARPETGPGEPVVAPYQAVPLGAGVPTGDGVPAGADRAVPEVRVSPRAEPAVEREPMVPMR